MSEIGQLLKSAERSAENAATGAFVFWILLLVVALGVSCWMFNDAESRGKNGIAAFLVTSFAAYYGISAIVIVVGTWILLRPDLAQRGGGSSESDLPDKLPSGMEIRLTSDEFLQDLAEDE